MLNQLTHWLLTEMCVLVVHTFLFKFLLAGALLCLITVLVLIMPLIILIKLFVVSFLLQLLVAVLFVLNIPFTLFLDNPFLNIITHKVLYQFLSYGIKLHVTILMHMLPLRSPRWSMTFWRLVPTSSARWQWSNCL